MFARSEILQLFDNQSEYGKKYTFGPLTNEMIERAEKTVGFKLPKSYVDLLKLQNGGLINFNNAWLTIIYGISPEPNAYNGLEKEYKHYIEDWQYPRDIGIPFGQTQSAGEDLYYFDCRNLDLNNEPSIVRVDIETEEIYKVADNFKSFINMILNKFEISETLIGKFKIVD